MIDQQSEYGRRVMRRLEEERIIWLTATDNGGTPQPRPVWFLWDGETFSQFAQTYSKAIRVRPVQLRGH